MGEERKEEGVKVKATYIRITVIIITSFMTITIIIMITIIITATLPLYHHPRLYPGWRDVRQ